MHGNGILYLHCVVYLLPMQWADQIKHYTAICIFDMLHYYHKQPNIIIICRLLCVNAVHYGSLSPTACSIVCSMHS